MVEFGDESLLGYPGTEFAPDPRCGARGIPRGVVRQLGPRGAEMARLLHDLGELPHVHRLEAHLRGDSDASR